MNEKMPKRRIQIRELQKQEIEKKQERGPLIRFQENANRKVKCYKINELPILLRIQSLEFYKENYNSKRKDLEEKDQQ